MGGAGTRETRDYIKIINLQFARKCQKKGQPETLQTLTLGLDCYISLDEFYICNVTADKIWHSKHGVLKEIAQYIL